MFPFRLRLTPSARPPPTLEIKIWVPELLTIPYHGVSPASWRGMANIGSVFRAAVSAHFAWKRRRSLTPWIICGTEPRAQLQPGGLEIPLRVLNFTTSFKYQGC